MKYIVILADGAADFPLDILGGKTPLQAAHKPYIDTLCMNSRMGLLSTVPDDMSPGSEVANLSVMGYDVKKVFQGRGVLEAASMGVDVKPGELAMRCNLVSLNPDGTIKNHSSGHISTEEAGELIKTLQNHFRDSRFSFYPGVSYRHLFVLQGGSNSIVCTPPHDAPGAYYRDVLVKPVTQEGKQTASILNGIIEESREILSRHPVNLKRISEHKDPANAVWFWSPGYRPKMETFQELYGKTGSVISAVDLIFGIGIYAGLEPVHVEGATGLYDTNYEGKAAAAIEAVRKKDFVFLHVEASDEAGHEGDAPLKVKTIEYLDRRLVRPIIEAVSAMDEPVTIAILPDHPTPCSLRTHVHDPVPFMIYTPGLKGDGIVKYDEESAKQGSLGLLKGKDFLRLLFGILSP